ncbi:MAG: tetratricopeptide repeat protein [Methanothrix sp.]|nr:tetratricopeptide repeat protein [Methanothrix sp.]
MNQSFAAAWKQKGNALLNLTKYIEALECNNKAIELDPKYASAWNNKGVALLELGEYDEAIKAWDEAIRLAPNDAVSWNNKAVALDDLGKYDEAATAFGEANRLDPKNYDAWNATKYRLSHSPDWMEVVSNEQGRGLNCCIILHNDAGTMIRSDGTLRIEIYEDNPATKLWSKSYSVNVTDFVDTTAGLGLFAHPVTIWHTGRISYDTIKPGLGDLSSEKSVSLEIRAYFETNDGRTLKDKTSEYVN